MTAPPLSLSDMFGDPYFREQMQKTPEGRRQLLVSDAQKNKAELQAAITEAQSGLAKLSGDEAARTQEWIAKQQDQLKKYDYLLSTGGQRAGGSTDQGTLSNLVRGAAAGAFSALPELAGTLSRATQYAPTSILSRLILNRVAPGAEDAGKATLADLAQAPNEAFNPEGTAGSIGKFVGGVVGSAPVLGPLAGAGASGIASAAEAVGAKGLAGLLRTGLQGNVVQRAGASVVGGLPLSATLQAGMPEGATAKDRLTQFGMQTLADLVGGAAHGVLRGKSEAAPVAPDASAPAAPGAVPAAPAAPAGGTAQAIADKLAAKAAATEALQAAKAKYNAGARDETAIEYMTSRPADAPAWNALDTEKQKAMVTGWKKRNPFQAQGQSGTPTPTPVEAPSAEAQAAAQPVAAEATPPTAGATPEQIVQAATLRHDNGKILTGALHVDARGAEGYWDPAGVDGFVTNKGRFLTRDEALAFARTAHPDAAAEADYEAARMQGTGRAIGDTQMAHQQPLLTAENFGESGVPEGQQIIEPLRQVVGFLRQHGVEVSGGEQDNAIIERIRAINAQGLDPAARSGQITALGNELLATGLPGGKPAEPAAAPVEPAPALSRQDTIQNLASFKGYKAIQQPSGMWSLTRSTLGGNSSVQIKDDAVFGFLQKAPNALQPAAAAGTLPAVSTNLYPSGEPAASAAPEPAAPAASPVLPTPEAAPVPAPAGAAAPADARAWWNSLKPADRMAWATSVDPTAEKFSQISKMRYDALSSRRQPIVDQAFARSQQGATPTDIVSAPETPVPVQPVPAESPAKAPANYSDIVAGNQVKTPLPPKEIRSASRQPQGLDQATLDQHITTAGQMSAQATDPNVQGEWDRVGQKLAAEVQRRAAVAAIPQGFANLRLLSSVGGGFAGFTTGLWTTDPQDPNRAAKLFMWTMIGVKAGSMAGKWADAKLATKLETSNYQLPTEPLKNVVSLDVLQAAKQKSLPERLMDFYSGTARSIAPAEKVAVSLRPYSDETARAASQKLRLFGWNVAASEAWIHDRPVLRGSDGEPVYMIKSDGSYVWSLKDIVDHANGDVKGLGDLAVALHTLEQFAEGRDPGTIPQERATMIREQAPEHMLESALEFREYHLALMRGLLQAGRITQAGYDAMAAQSFYTPLYRVIEGGEVRKMNAGNQRVVSMADPLKAVTESGAGEILNPVQQTIALTPRYLRAIEFNEVVQKFVDMGRAIGDKDVAKIYMQLVKPDANSAQGKALRELETQLRSGAKVLGLHPNDIAGLMPYMNTDSPAFHGGYITHWENGVLKTYKIAEPVFNALRSLLPDERDMLQNILIRGSRGVSMGIVNNPVFLVRQLVMDSMDAATMTKYGFRLGIDSLRALYHIYARTPEYKRLIEMGGPGTIQSLPYLNPEKVMSSLASEGNNALAIAFNQMKQMQPLQAYKTLALPLAESARVGEALRAMDHGASTLDAVDAAWNVLGNTRVQGSAGFIRATNAMVPFLRASTAILDQQAANSGLHPFRTPDEGRLASGLSLLVRGFANLTVPTMLLWASQRDDAKLREWRQSAVGQNYWFIRSPLSGEIVRIPKPHDFGLIFASAVEDALDKHYAGGDAATVGQWADSFLNQTAMTVYPVLVGVPLSAAINKRGITGNPIASDADMRLAPEMRGHDTATYPARVIGGVLGKIPFIGTALSAPNIDYMAQGFAGETGQQVMEAGNLVRKYMDNGYVPAAYELPVIKSFLVHYPTMNMGPVEQFYNNTEKLEESYQTYMHLVRDDPNAAVAWQQSHAAEIQMAGALSDTRTQIADLRRAANDVDQLGQSYMTSTQARELKDMFAQAIIDKAKAGNLIWKAMQENNPQP